MKRDEELADGGSIPPFSKCGEDRFRRGLASQVDTPERRLSVKYPLVLLVGMDELSAKPIDANDAIYDQAIAA